jgi:hypothetical protein
MTATDATTQGADIGPAPKVLYIGGTGRTGSTVLGKLLGQFNGVFFGGELTFLWEYGLGLGGRCSCGARLARCEVWSSILQSAFGADPPDPERMVELRRRFWSGHLPLMLLPGGGSRGLRRLEEFPQGVERLYRAIASVTGARVIVDSSKEPHYSYILREGTDLPVYFLHLVRDPRAVGYSWHHRRLEQALDDGVAVEQRGPLRVSLYYVVSNVAAEALWARHPRYRLLRYEDFVERPREALATIGELLEEELPVDDVLEGGRFQVEPLHSAWGNPNRFERGIVELTSDDRWRSNLGQARRIELASMNWPLMRRYGYAGSKGARSAAWTSHPITADGDNSGPIKSGRPGLMMDQSSFERTLWDVRSIPGWLRNRQAKRLWEVARSVPDGGQIVEIGSFQGLSTIVLARAASTGVALVSIDPHAGNDRGPGEWDGSPEDGRRDHLAFKRHLRRCEVAGRVRHICRASSWAHRDVPGEIDLLYVDGSHRYRDALADLRDWGSRVREGGAMLVHDSYASVFVTAATYRSIVLSGAWRYVGREGSLAEYRRERVQGGARVVNVARQLGALGSFARNLAVKLLCVVRLERLAVVLGHRPGDGVY